MLRWFWEILQSFPSTEITPSLISTAELPTNAKRPLQKNDVIVSTVRTYRGGIAIIDNDNLIGSGAFTVLQENGKINKETLLVFLRLKPMLDFSLKFATGLAYPVINDSDILNFPLPLFPKEIQEKIKSYLTQSRHLRTTAKHLLDSAKTAVEIAIEQDEHKAMAFFTSTTKSSLTYLFFGKSLIKVLSSERVNVCAILAAVFCLWSFACPPNCWNLP